MALRVTFLAFPAISSLAFKAFRCLPLIKDDAQRSVSVMEADYSIVCRDEDDELTPTYRRILATAWTAIVLYPICVTFFYVYLLCKLRKSVWANAPSRLRKSMEFMTDEYRTDFFFWELVESVKKLVLVGGMSVVLEGSITQLVIAFIIVLISLVALLVSKPYRRNEDNVIALAAGFGLVMFFFFSLILKFQVLVESVANLPTYLHEQFNIDAGTNTILLLCSIFLALVLGGALIIVEVSANAVHEAEVARERARLERENAELRAAQQASAEELAAMGNVLNHDSMPDVMRRCLIDMSAIQFGKRLGAGAFGTPVAVKKLHRNRLDEENLRAFKAECELQLSLRHPNLVQLIGGSWTLEDINVCIVLEVCEKGTLMDLLEKEPSRSQLSWSKHKLSIASGIGRAMAYLHAQKPPVIHRDLKPENVLIDDGYNAKIADFGCSREADATRTMEVAGTPLFSAPELLRRERYDEKVDVWAFACCLECMWTHEMVYNGADDPGDEGPAGILRRIGDEELRPHVDGFLNELVARSSDFDVDCRLTFAQVNEYLSTPSLASQATFLAPGPRNGSGAPQPRPKPAQKARQQGV